MGAANLKHNEHLDSTISTPVDVGMRAWMPCMPRGAWVHMQA